MSDELDRRIEDAKRHLYDLYAQRKMIRAAEKRKNRQLPVEEMKAKIITMFHSGLSVNTIASELNRSLGTIRLHLRDAAFEVAEAKYPYHASLDSTAWFDAVEAEQKRIMTSWKIQRLHAQEAG